MWANPITLWRKGILGMNCRNVGYIGRYNPRERYPLVDDKLLTKMVVRKAGVAAPELLLVIRLQHEIEHIEHVLANFTQFVIKPARGSGGKGILVIVGRDGDRLIKSSGSKLSAADVKRHLSNIISGLYSLGGRTDVAFVEALVTADATFEHISYEGVPDIRLIVFKGYPVMGMLRLATKRLRRKGQPAPGRRGRGPRHRVWSRYFRRSIQSADRTSSGHRVHPFEHRGAALAAASIARSALLRGDAPWLPRCGYRAGRQ